MAAWLEKALGAWREPAPGLVLMLGAGDGELLQPLQSLGASRVVLVEGHPDLAARLQRKVADWPGFSVLALAVSADGAELEWQLTEPARFAGPQRPSGLLRHYPRLRRLGSRRMGSQALAPLLTEVLDAATPDEAGRPSLLLVNLPGQEASLFSACEKPLLQRFDAIVLRGCSEALWEDAAPIDAAAQVLAKRGFKARLVDRVSEPLWPLVELVVDKQKVEIERLQWRLERSQSELEQARARAVNERQLADEQRVGREQAERAAEQAGVELLSLRRAKLLAEQLAQEHWQTIELLAQERDAALERRLALEPELATLRGDLQRQGERVEQLQQQLQASQQQLDAQSRQLTELLEQRQQEQIELDHQRQRADEACRRLQQMTQELVLAEGQLELVKDLLLGDPTL
jgi:hypothetical protein